MTLPAVKARERVFAEFSANLKPTVSLDGRRWLKQLFSAFHFKIRASVSDAFFIWKGE